MKKLLVIGGGGFIGINSALRYLDKGYEVSILDNFSRKGSRDNISWLKKHKKSASLKIIEADIRINDQKLKKAALESDLILHFAAQVAVTTSVINPREDFEINALGTFNVLEAVRKSGNSPILIYASTNKVYGELEDVRIVEEKTRYSFKGLKFGIPESRNLDFHSPYGCSKGAADQYVRDYHRIYNLNTVVFRQSCIYGPHQFGIEDQGWVAWFIIALVLGKKITIYGNGKQVRDVLYIDDLLDAYDLAIENIKNTRGKAYNIGGGILNTISVWHEFKPILENLFQKKINVESSEWRPGDQPIFISDTRLAKKDFGWEPKIGVKEGIKMLYDWVHENKAVLAKYF